MSDDREEQPRSALEDLQPFAWPDEQSVSYEVALELIGQVVAGYEALIDREQSKVSPDAEAVNALTEAEDHFIARRTHFVSPIPRGSSNCGPTVQR
jgi:hypothetical protein